MNRLAELILETALGNDLIQVRRDYSGRGMYGRSCLGVVSTESLIREFFLPDVIDNIYSTEGDAARNLVGDLLSYRQDTMGHDIIVYWPELDVETEAAVESFKEWD